MAKRAALPVIVSVITAPPAVAQVRCDAALHPVEGGDAYKLRGDRCEGVYARAVALGEVHLVGVNWKPSRAPSLQNSRTLKLVWATAPAGEEVRVRAWALRPRLFYRMDSVRPAGASGYDWPDELLVRLNLTAADLGVVAWSRVQVQGVAKDVFLPVGFGGDITSSQHVELTLLSDVQLKEIYLTIFPVASDGKIAPPLYKDVPVKRGYYPANRGIAVTLPPLTHPGFYRVDIGSSFTDGGASALSQLIYLTKPSG